MRKVTLKRSKIGIALIIIIVMIALLALHLCNMQSTVYAATLEPNEIDSFTSSDQLAGLEMNNIRQYGESLEDFEATYGQNVTIINSEGLFMNNSVFSYNGKNNLIANIYGDDNITRIIPKELFANSGSLLHIGEENGFYIETTVHSFNSLVNASTVLVFDIVNNPAVTINNPTPNFRVDVLFQFKYLYIKSTTAISINPFRNFTYNLHNCSNVVVPAVDLAYSGGGQHGSYQHSPKIQQSMAYALSDVSFAAKLSNEQYLNEPDAGYITEDDNGMFFTGEQYTFRGKTYQNGSITNFDTWQLIQDTTEFALGFVPFVGDVLSVSNYIFSTVTAFHKALSGFTQEAYSYNLNVQSNLGNKSNQIKAPPLGYGKLLKDASVIVNTTEKNTVLLTQGDWAEVKFNVNQTLESRARLSRTIGLKIYSLVQNEFIDIGMDSRYFTINDPEYKDAFVGVDSQIYTLPKGNDYFSFTPQYNGFYSFDILNNNISFIVKYNDNELSLSANDDYFLEGNKTYQIEFSSENTVSLSIPFIIKLRNKLSDINVPANSNCLIQYDFTNASFNIISLSNSALKITNIFVYQDGLLVNYDFDYHIIYESNILNVPMTQGIKYILISNEQATNLSTNVIIEEVDSITTGINNNLTIEKNWRYNKFIVPSSGSYSITFDFPNTSNIIDIWSSNMEKMSVQHLPNAIIVHGLIQGQTIWIGYRNVLLNQANGTITINSFENALS